MIPTLAWTPEGVRFIDQTKLPLEESYVLATTYQQVADVIVTMVVRGAPAIGVSAAYGIALGAIETTAATPQEFAARVREDLRSSRRHPADGCQSLLGYRSHEATLRPPASLRRDNRPSQRKIPGRSPCNV